MLGLFAGIAAISLGLKGFTSEGLPLTKQQNLTGTPAKVVGVICVFLGIMLLSLGTILRIAASHYMH